MSSNRLTLNVPSQLHDLAVMNAKAANFISTEAYILHVLGKLWQPEDQICPRDLQGHTTDGRQGHNAELGFNEASEGSHLYALWLGFNDADELHRFGARLNSDDLNDDAKGATAEEITE